MIARLSARERRIVAIGLGALLVAGAWTLGVEPILERNRINAERLPVREQLLQRRLDLVARKDAIARDLDAASARLQTLGARFLTPAAPPVAAAEVQKLAKELAAEAKTEVRSERILPPVERGELLEIPVEIAVSGEIRQVVDLLARLDGAAKLLTVQDLKIRVLNVSQPKDLLVTVTLAGYILRQQDAKS
ncbi:MAG: hypothetical protein HY727_18735 [Candidatus Rokubacteria bacterium]|nr:hypothetical protein [Candidatus Rokubacteria bacterium]